MTLVSGYAASRDSGNLSDVGRPSEPARSLVAWLVKNSAANNTAGFAYDTRAVRPNSCGALDMGFFPKRADEETLGAYPPLTLDGITLATAISPHIHLGGYGRVVGRG